MRNMLNHGVGKGDKSRVDDVRAYEENLAAVQFTGVTGLEKRGSKSVKVYGRKEVVKLTGKIIIH